MKVSNKGIAEIAGHEGIVLSPYFDSVGVKTIAVGHTARAGGFDPDDIALSDEISIEKAMRIFKRDLKKFEKRVNDAVKVPLEQHQFDALVSFDYNTGGIYKAKLTKELNAGNYSGAARNFMGWKKPPEIIPRRKKEQALFRTGNYGNGKASIFETDGKGRVNWSSAKSVDVLSLMELDQIVPVPQKKPEVSTEETVSFLAILFRLILKLFGGK